MKLHAAPNILEWKMLRHHSGFSIFWMWVFNWDWISFYKENTAHKNTFRSLEFGATNLDVDLAAAPAKFSMGIQHQYVNG